MKPKRRKCSSEYQDRLSEMPDEVIIHILSCMPTIYAVRTMLIRRFGNLWTLIHTLNFEFEETIYKLRRDGRRSRIELFNIFVCNVLMLHKRPSIEKLYLLLGDYYVNYGKEGDGEITMCLRLALEKQAKEIYFGNHSYEYSNSSNFPHFTSQSLVTLELSDTTIYPPLQVNLGSLKKLILDYISICEEALGQFICGCPSLQELHILEPRYIRNLRFSAPNIQKLFFADIEGGPYNDHDDSWLFDFPNLKSLVLEMKQIPDVIDASSVRDVYLKELCFSMDDEDTKAFLEKFSGSEVFQLSLKASEPILHSIEALHPLKIRWKRVVLGLRLFCESCLLGFYQLMRSSKHLEELIIHTTTELTWVSVHNTPNLPPVELSDPCVMPKLKTIYLHSYLKSSEPLLQLIEFLLKSATVLEKLIIVPNQYGLTAVEERDFVMHVSTFQRSSPSARVFFR